MGLHGSGSAPDERTTRRTGTHASVQRSVRRAFDIILIFHFIRPYSVHISVRQVQRVLCLEMRSGKQSENTAMLLMVRERERWIWRFLFLDLQLRTPNGSKSIRSARPEFIYFPVSLESSAR